MKWQVSLLVVISIMLIATACNQVVNPYTRSTQSGEVELGVEQSDAFFNRPFITIDETLQFYYGISQSSVKTICGEPLYVALGSIDRTVWVYVVRELWVGDGVGNNQLTKTGTQSKIMSPMHYLGLTFESGALVAWAPVTSGQIFDSLIYGDYLEVIRDAVVGE